MKSTLFYLGLASILLSSCGEKDVAFNLPKEEPTLIIEAYLLPNELLRVTLSKSSDYFQKNPGLPFEDSAIVILKYPGEPGDTLNYNPFPDFENAKWYNYLSSDSIPYVPGQEYTLEVRTNDGKVATAKTIAPGFIPITKLELKEGPREDTTYLVLTTFQDPIATNFYRYRVRNLSTISDTAREDIVFGYLGDDKLENDLTVILGGPYIFEAGETGEVILYHITEQYWNWYSSAEAAESAVGNPFGTPTYLEGNFTGAIGIFTAITKDMRIVIAPR